MEETPADTQQLVVITEEYQTLVVPSDPEDLKLFKRRPWQPHEDEILKAMLPDGSSYADVGRMLNRSSYSVQSRAVRLQLPYPYGDREMGVGSRADEVIGCLRRGMTYLQMSKKFGVSRGKIAGWVHRLRNTPGVHIPVKTPNADGPVYAKRTVHKSVASARKRAKERLKKQLEKDAAKAAARQKEAEKPYIPAPVKRPWASPVQIPVLTENPLPNEPVSLRMSIVDLEANNCRYVHGDPKADHHCCGHTTRKNSVYCDFHHKLCYTSDTRRLGGWVHAGMAASIRLRHFLR